MQTTLLPFLEGRRYLTEFLNPSVLHLSYEEWPGEWKALETYQHQVPSLMK